MEETCTEITEIIPRGISEKNFQSKLNAKQTRGRISETAAGRIPEQTSEKNP